MTSEHKPILTNVGVYRSIADAAYRKVSEDMGENVRPRPDGDPGVIKAFDPEQLSFKQAMISVVFTCIWLEATLHLLIVGKHGRKCFREVDKVPYETKLHLWTLLTKVETSCDRILIAGGANVEAEWEQGPAV